MSSAISDVLQNPKEESSSSDSWLGKIGNLLSSAASSTEDALSSAKDSLTGNGDNLLNRGMYSLNKGMAFLPDALVNALSKGVGLGNVIPHDPIESAMRKIGAIQDLPSASTTPQKLAEGAGSAIGSSILPLGVGAAGEAAGTIGQALGKALLGTDAPLTSASQLANPTAAATLGATVAPVAAKPAIENYTQNPLTRGALELGSSAVGGGLAGALTNMLMKSPETLPLVTEAQRQIPGTPEARDLESKQLSLISRSPKAADAVDKISSNQQDAIINNLQSGASGMKGEDVKDAIVTAVQKLKDEKSQAYQQGMKSVAEQSERPEGQPLPLTNTEAAVNDLLGQKSSGGKISKTIAPILDQIKENQNGSLPEIADTASDISKPTHPISGLQLGQKEQYAAGKIAQAYAEDIEAAYPGFKAVNEQYGDHMRQLENILQGPVGKEAKLADQSPSKVFKDIFEKADPELQTQLQQVIPAPLYKQASQQYLSNVVDTTADQTPLKGMNNTNRVDQMQRIGNILKNKTLPETLPAAEQKTADQAIRDIQQNMTGQTKAPYILNSRIDNSTPVFSSGQSLAVAQHPVGALAKIGDTLMGGPIKNNLQYNEMMGAGTPASQIATSAGQNAARLGQRAAEVDSMNAHSKPQPQQVGSQVALPITPQSPSSMDDYMNSLGIRGDKAQGQIQMQKPGSSMDDYMNSLGIRGDKSPTVADKGPLPALTDDQLNFLSKKIKSGDFKPLAHFDDAYKDYQDQIKNNPYQGLMDSLRDRESRGNYQAVNKQGFIGAYQMGAQALEDIGLLKPGASKFGNQILSNPNAWNINGGANGFLSNPDIQDEAMKRYLDLNKARLTNAGFINSNTPQSQQNGLLAAAHIGGVVGAANLRRGIAARDANGTSTANYYNLGMGA
jgi:hypothetical protein